MTPTHALGQNAAVSRRETSFSKHSLGKSLDPLSVTSLLTCKKIFRSWGEYQEPGNVGLSDLDDSGQHAATETGGLPPARVGDLAASPWAWKWFRSELSELLGRGGAFRFHPAGRRCAVAQQTWERSRAMALSDHDFSHQ